MVTWGRKCQEKLWFVSFYFLTLYKKVIEVQQMPCCFTSSIYIAVWQDEYICYCGFRKKWHRLYDSFYCLISADQINVLCLKKAHGRGAGILSCRLLNIKQLNSLYFLNPISLLLQVCEALKWIYNKTCMDSFQYNKYLLSTHSVWDTMQNIDAINSQSVIIQTQPGINIRAKC